MLTREENRWNLKFFEFCSIWIFLPISIDVKSGRISIQEKVYKLYIWYFLFGLELLHSAYGLVRLIQLLYSPDLSQKMDHLFIHSLVLMYPICKFMSFQVFIKRPQETVMLLNQLFYRKNQPKTNVPPRKIFTWNCKYNRHELITLSIPFGINAVCLILIVVFLSNPDRLWNLYSCVPAQFQFKITQLKSWPLFLFLTGVDVYFFFRAAAEAIFFLLTQFFFLEHCYTIFGSFQQNPIFRNSIEMPRARPVENLLKEMQLHFDYVHLFNRVHAYTIFACKQSVLFYATFSGFCAVRLNFQFPLASALAAYIHLLIMFIYSFMYEKAFTIPENWRKVKSGLRVSALLSTIKKYPEGGGKAARFQKEIQSVPEIGVKVGDFHMLERESTPNFIMFVISSVASLLITFR